MLLEGALIAVAVALLVPAIIVAVEAAAAVLPDRATGHPLPASSMGPARLAVLIPAHNESAQIAATISDVIDNLKGTARIVVVADNCSDDTALVAAAAGATVIERHDPERRGKGFAISFGLRHLDVDPPQAIILIDADCRVAAGSLQTLAELALRHQRPVQAEYLLVAPPTPRPMIVVSALAVLLRNQVRPRGMRRLGLPCHLTGSGMAFPWRVLRDAPEMEANLVEDLVMGIEMALRGQPPLLCSAVQIASELPDENQAGMTQRRRWEHGQLLTLRTYVPRLLLAGLRRGRADLFAIGLDLMVPPLALLVALQLSLVASASGLALVGVTSSTPALLAIAGLAAVGAAVGGAWLRFGRRALPARGLLFVPFYLLWKIPLYAALLVRRRQRTWERTARRQS